MFNKKNLPYIVRAVPFVLFVVLGLAFFTSADPRNTTSGKKIITVGFSQCKMDESDWRMANTRSMQDTLNGANGFRLIIADSNNDAAKQVADVQNFINS